MGVRVESIAESGWLWISKRGNCFLKIPIAHKIEELNTKNNRKNLKMNKFESVTLSKKINPPKPLKNERKPRKKNVIKMIKY
jgi:hypothetical protein